MEPGICIKKLLDNGRKKVNQLHKVISNRNVNLSASRLLLTLGACAARVTVVVVCVCLSVCLSVCYSITHFTSGYSRPKRTHIFSGGWRSKNM